MLTLINHQSEPKNCDFLIACEKNNLEQVKYFLTCKQLFIDINCKDSNLQTGLMKAVLNGNIEIMDYLLNSPDFETYADITIKDSLNVNAFMYACSEGSITTVDYLLNCSQKNLIDIYDNNNHYHDSGFLMACNNNCFSLVEYFLYEIKIIITQEDIEKIKKNVESIFPEDQAGCDQILQMIEKRDLFFQLQQKLKENSSLVHANKI